jgi:hypothetical protein
MAWFSSTIAQVHECWWKDELGYSAGGRMDFLGRRTGQSPGPATPGPTKDSYPV